ncbi:atp-dependent dna helicase pif1 [Stemphylium lycopersici]|nr:atp-dependent dna helicase pif1 [Stemphylium lycopersici]
MSLFGGSAPPSRSSYDSDTSASSSTRSSPSVVEIPGPHETQEAQQLDAPVLLDANDDIDTDTDPEDAGSGYDSEDEPARPNRFLGQPQTWQGYTEADRQIAESLDQIQDSDLAAHLYNAHALKRRLRRPAEDTARFKNWQSRDTWLKSGKDLEYEDAAGVAQTALVPSKEWTAWPVPPAQLPGYDGLDNRPAGGQADEWNIGSISRKDAGDELREELLATFLRTATERWTLREASSSGSDSGDYGPTSRSRSRSRSRADFSMKDAGADQDATQRETGEGQEHTSQKKRGRKPRSDTFSKAVVLADDARAQRLLQASIQSMMSRLDELALAVRRTRLNHFGRGPADSSMSEFTSGAESSGHVSRSSSKARSEKPTSRKPSTRPSSRTSSIQESRMVGPETENVNDGVKTGDSDPTSDDASDWEESNKVPHQRKRHRFSSSPSDSGASTVQDAELREGLLDWSEILGLAAVKGWDREAVARTTQRCAALFGESMSFIPFGESLASKPEPILYTPAVIPAPNVPSVSGPPAPKRPFFQVGTLRCPHSDCYGHEKDFALPYRVVEHCMRVHGYDPRTNDSENEERTVGGVHIDGFLQPVTAKPGWLGHGRTKAGNKRKLDEEHQSTYGKRARQDQVPGSFTPPATTPDNTQAYSTTEHETQYGSVMIQGSPERGLGSVPRREVSYSAQSALAQDMRDAGLFVQASKRGAKKPKYYAVAHGRVPGIYTDWGSAEKQTSGLSHAVHKKFNTIDDAWTFMEANRHHTAAILDCQTRTSDTSHVSRPAQAQPTVQWMQPSTPPFRNTCPLPTPPSKPSLQPVEDDAPLPPQRVVQEQEQPASSPQPWNTSTQDFAPPPSPQPPPPEPTLSAEQEHVVDLIVRSNKNVFYTGSAGCGKSTILNDAVKQLIGSGKRVQILAPTNLAAYHVNGQTTWSFAGWRPDKMNGLTLKKVRESAHGKDMWHRLVATDVLIIDEISMVENLHFQRLDELMKSAFSSPKAFGGVKVVVTGDFCQLAPVKPFQFCIGCGEELKNKVVNCSKQYICPTECGHGPWLNSEKWAFQSDAWKECKFEHVNLKKIHRQNDFAFLSILKKLRTDGHMPAHHRKVLLSKNQTMEEAIKLLCLRNEVDAINRARIKALPSPALEYKCLDCFERQAHHRDNKLLDRYTLLDNNGNMKEFGDHRYQADLVLKQDMRVLLLANIDIGRGLVNGSQGIITRFEDYHPDKLLRKSDGPNARYVDRQTKDFVKLNKYQPWPVVKFDNGFEITIYADCPISEVGDVGAFSLVSRTQIPLVAGYAITVHKSQGMTLDRVIVDLSKAFEASQLYVALSRARSLQGLRVLGLPYKRLCADAAVKWFIRMYLEPKDAEKANDPGTSTDVSPPGQPSQQTLSSSQVSQSSQNLPLLQASRPSQTPQSLQKPQSSQIPPSSQY